MTGRGVGVGCRTPHPVCRKQRCGNAIAVEADVEMSRKAVAKFTVA